MELTALYNKFISEGFNNFYIEGVGGPQPDDVYCLGFDNQNWSVYYIERGQKSKPVFTTQDKMDAINFYTDFVSNIEHWHLVVFTRSTRVFNNYKQKLEILNIRTIQNDIPAMSFAGDIVHRLFVVNKDIFSAKSACNDLPYFDNDLKG
ncbi:MAG: hypothetical protein IPL54_14240 [Chitinophagaceae bacterium]|nr:hypothetical protein [Chitinophagaceae bacterium]